MLNCFSLYSIIWIVVLGLYDLGWSDYCSSLDIRLRLFIYFSIAFSFLLSLLFNSRMKYRKVEHAFNISYWGTLIICALQMVEYLYCRRIPLIEAVFRGGDYADFAGIPSLHVILYTFATFYCQYLFYAFLCEKKRKYLVYYAAILVAVFGLQFMRGGLTICLGISALMLLASVQHRIRVKHVFYAVIAILVAAYLFGGLGNIRHGSAWGDSSEFLRFGRINDKFPNWIPKQFSWVYTYIVGSLATLNYNVTHNFSVPDVALFFQTIVPDFIKNRLWPNVEFRSALLIWKGFTTTTGYFNAYYYGGVFGLYAMYFVLVVFSVIMTTRRFFKEEYRVLVMANVGVIISLYFFTNAIAKSAISFSVVYPFLISRFGKRRRWSIDGNRLSITFGKKSQFNKAVRDD